MAVFNAKAALPDGQPGPWGEPVAVSYEQRDVLLYAVGIGCTGLPWVFEGDPAFAVFPTFAIRWSGAGAPIDRAAIPPTPGPLTLDAERRIEIIRPLPLSGTVTIQSRLVGVFPRGTSAAFVETESVVRDAQGRECVRLANGSFRRGVSAIGDIEPFEGAGETRFGKIIVPDRAPDVTAEAAVAANQAAVYRLSGDYNPLHIDPQAAAFGGFPAPILHGLCTVGITARLLIDALCGGDGSRFGTLRLRFSAPVYPGETLTLAAWADGPGRHIFEVRASGGIAGQAAGRTVVSHAFFAQS